MVGEDASQETRERRVAKRVEGVQAIMRTTAYIVVTTHCADAPAPPDPHDQTKSKRAWEKSMMRWRAALRETLHEIQVQAAVQRGG